MRLTPDFSRPLERGEEDRVDSLLRAAFRTHAEAQFVRKLRKTKVIAGEQVMPMGDDIVGYYVLSYLIKPKRWLALGPVAIHPDHQGNGYGKRMIGMLSEWARLTQTPVVASGASDFFGKCGFSAEAGRQLAAAKPLGKPSVVGVTGFPSETLQYPSAFERM